MARYFFDVIGPSGSVRDEEGQDYGSLTDARDDAMRAAKELTAQSLLRGEKLGTAMLTKLEVRDEAGGVAITVPFSMAANAEDYAP